MWRICFCLLAVVALFHAVVCAEGPATKPVAGLEGVKGVPVGVWLQDPKNVERYKEVGINLYVGLWEGPTAGQLGALKKAGMGVICEQNAEGLKEEWKGTVVGFMHGDEPDNAQEKKGGAGGGGYGPPVLPEKIVEGYKGMKGKDGRPVLLNLGQGVAWDNYIGRGVRTNKPEDYAAYVKGCDIASFDIYPASHEDKAVAGKLEFVGNGVARLKKWAEGRPVWACIETTRISNLKRGPTPEETREEVWMAIANGATGIIYFAHEFKPKFIEAGLLADKEMAAGVKKVNAEVQALAGPILEGEDDPTVKVESSEEHGISVLVRKWHDATYVIVVGMSAKSRTVTISVPEMRMYERLMPGNLAKLVTKQWVIQDYSGYEVLAVRLSAWK